MATDNKKTNFISVLFKLLYYLVISFVCLIVFVLIFYIISSQLHANDENYKPSLSIYTIVSPSMTPVIKVYDVVVNVKITDPTDIQVGDIITYKSAAANSEGMTITHRVVEISRLPDGTYEYMTQGDNNSEPDSLYVTFDNVIGKEILIIPFIGKVQLLIANQKGWLFLLLIPISIYLVIEVIKLIDLFHLRKKVNKVVGTTEENFIEQKRQNKIKEEERKEQLKEELANMEVKKISLQKSEEEPTGFLEQYSETIVKVKENKYAKTIKPKKLEVDLPELKTEKEEKNSMPIIPISPEEKIEVLDTDDLTSKIKEYDQKIEELDKVIKELKSTKKNDDKSIVVEDENFLKETKIRVTDIEPVKKTRKKNASEELIPSSRRHIRRPEAEDISAIRSKELTKTVSPSKSPSKSKKDSLNLNPKNIKKINRPNKKTVSNRKKLDVKVSLDASTIRNTDSKRKRVIKESEKSQGKPLIVIKKTK